ncbi:MAG TPA: hypothetical protein VHX65_19460 [Pirellulales bacterium]|nr:hypothetical protein [Pirellulales bacterium]
MARENGSKLPVPSPLREMVAAILLGFVATGTVWAMDWLAERRQEVERMTPAEKEDLNEKYQRFLALPADEQEQLRLLHQQLEVDRNGDRLRRVMQRYYDWLKTLQPGERADLLSLPPTERLAKIKTLKQDQEAWAAKLSGGSHLTLHDVQVLSDWVKKYAAAHEVELTKDMPQRHHGQSFPVLDEESHERMVQFSAWRHWSAEKTPAVSADEIEHLMGQLSTKPREALEAQPMLHDKADIVHQWLQAIARTRFAGGFGKQGPNVSRKDLARFFEHLPKDQQDELSQLSEEARHRELRKRFLQYRRSTGFSTGGDREPHFNHPGGPWPADSPERDHEPPTHKGPPPDKAPPNKAPPEMPPRNAPPDKPEAEEQSPAVPSATTPAATTPAATIPAATIPVPTTK